MQGAQESQVENRFLSELENSRKQKATPATNRSTVHRINLLYLVAYLSSYHEKAIEAL